MSRVLHRSPFAVTSGGAILLNARELVTGERLDDAVAAAKAADGRIFVGIELTTAELGAVLERLAHCHREAAAYLAGVRLRRRRPRGRR